MARPVVAGAGVVRQQRGGGTRPRRPHDRELAHGVLRGRPCRAGLRADGRLPPALDTDAQTGLKVAVQATPAAVGIALANWNWKVVRQFIEARCERRLSRATCLRSLHRLGFAYKRPKKRLLKADEAKRAAFIAQDAAVLVEAQAAGAKIFFADDAHFRAAAGCPLGASTGSGCSKGSPPWSMRPARAGGSRPATTRRSAWKPGRWSRWT